MFYIVFTHALESTEDFHIEYVGDEKVLAKEKYQELVSLSFSIDTPAKHCYFVGLKNPVVADLLKIVEKAADEFEEDDIKVVLKNLSSAACAYHLEPVVPFCARLAQREIRCEGPCGRRRVDLRKNIYGKCLCNKCYEDYLHSEDGYVEFAIGIADGKYNLTDFSDEEKALIKTSYTKYTEYINGQLEDLIPE